MKTFKTKTGPIAYDQRGGDGPPIFLLPSGAHDHHDYDELRDQLPEHYCTISLDWPAHGRSPAGDAPATAMRFADITEEIVARLAPDGALLVGNSVGGFAAARLAIRRPELVRGLVLIDSGGFLGRPPQVRTFCALMGHPRFLRAIYPRFSARYMRAKTDADKRAQATSISTTRNAPGLEAVSELWRSFASPEHDLRDEAHLITAPTLLIWGKHDPVIPYKIGVMLERKIPHARLVGFDAGHLPHTADPTSVAAELTAFAEIALAAKPSASTA